MRFFAGPLRTGGYAAILTALLLPVLGFGTASADLSVGDTIMLKVPDLAEFPDPVAEHQFTCRAVTEHAYWLVQDTCTVKEGSGPGKPDTVVWNNLIDQEELDSLTGDFEGNGINVYGTVTEYLGDIPDTDGEPRIYMVLATIRDQYSSGGQPLDRNSMSYVNPADLDGSGTFNDHDCIYVNLHTYTANQVVLDNIAKPLRVMFIPNGVGMLARYANNTGADPWIARALGEIAQFQCYGFTKTAIGGFGVQYDLDRFELAPTLELTNWQASQANLDFAASRAQGFLFLMYLAQRQGDAILETVTQSDTTSMLNLAHAIDSSVGDSLAIQTNVVPIYKDWLICNITNDLGDDMQGGIYSYEIFQADTTVFFSHINGGGDAFAGQFEEYPFDAWLPELGLVAPIWSAQYCEFTEDYSAYDEVYFNGAYADASGSGAPIDGKWYAVAISIDNVAEEIVAVTPLTLSDIYNGTFQLQGDAAYLMVTNNNPGGPADLRYIISQDTDEPDVLISVHQNSINDQYLTLYSTLFDSLPEGFDWFGPMFSATTGDSTGMYTMNPFYQSIWDIQFDAWTSGDFALTVAGYDSTGFSVTGTKNVAVGYASTGKLNLSVGPISLEVPAGAVAPGTMVSLAESSLLGLSVSTQALVEDLTGQLSGIIAGPVSVPDVNGTLSFPAENAEGSVFRFTTNGWERVHSYYQGGRMVAQITDGGQYAYGDAPGVSTPVLPADFRFGGVYPNPFSAEAAIRFSLPSASRVSVTIYDMSGRAVRSLNDSEMAAADHTLMWDGLDDSGHAVGAGVYFCRLQAAGQTVTQKMLRIE